MSRLSDSYWWSFREELFATAIVLMVAVAGSFFVISRVFSPPTSTITQNKLDLEDTTSGKVLGQETLIATPIMPTATLFPTSVPSPTVNPFDSEVFYGTGGLYDYDEYTLEFASPRISFDARNPQTRRFLVDVTLTNKNVAQGLQPLIQATIVKDGVAIVPQAPLSLKDFSLVLPGEKKTFLGRLSLIEGTDVSLIRFTPDGLTPIEHILRP